MYRSDVFVGRRNWFYGIGVFWIGERGEFLVVVVSLLVWFGFVLFCCEYCCCLFLGKPLVSSRTNGVNILGCF